MRWKKEMQFGIFNLAEATMPIELIYPLQW